MRTTLQVLLAAVMLTVAGHAAAQVTFYAGENFRGPSFTADRSIGNFERFGFNDRAASVVVQGGRWEVCEDARFSGRCVLLRAGQYPSLASIGLDHRVSSVRPAGRESHGAYAPAPVATERYEYYPRHGEALFSASVTSARAVVTQDRQQHCWVEREQVVRDAPGGPNVPGAIIGGVLGGVLGHQVGGGRGKDVATAVGAVGGAAIGAQAGTGGQVVTQDVQRCREVRGPMRPDYWDVTYVFRGQEHRVQLAAPPGPTITVNRLGEPRV
jgi:uncharacterized protein YcfJ